jgi:hypothetical protein
MPSDGVSALKVRFIAYSAINGKEKCPNRIDNWLSAVVSSDPLTATR